MSSNSQEMKKPRVSSRQITWLMAEAALPLLLIFFVFWPFASWAVPNQASLYERYFGSGDVIAVAITLIAPSTLRLISQKKTNFHLHLGTFLLILSILGGLFYGAIKIKYLSYTFPEVGQPDSTITDMTNFSLAFLTITIAAIFVATGMED